MQTPDLGEKGDEYTFAGDLPLGKGGFGCVWRVVNERTGDLFVLKVVPHQEMRDLRRLPGSQAGRFEMVEVEASLHRTLQHPNIVQFVEEWTDRGSFFMVLEYCHDGSLQDGIEEGKFKGSYGMIMRHLVSALAFCEEHSVIHCDIKPGW